MGVIRFSDGDVFNTDSQEYQILYNAARQIKGVPGAVVEIGTRMGGSAKLIIDALEENRDTDRPMFCIDPYGNIDYPETNKALTVFSPQVEKEGDPNSTELVKNIKHDYDNIMRNRVIPSLYYYAYQRGLNFTFFCLEDTEFFSRYYNGVPVYEEVKTLVNDYAFVFFDGPHTNDAVNTELAFFLSRAPKGCVYVFDDIWMYDHDKFEKQLFERGFELLEKGNIKASYKKGD
jgi:cephalosporin hydroxylase